MRYRRRLRSRIVLTFFVLGAGLTALFAVAVLALNARLEDDLIEESLQTEVDRLVDHVRTNPDEPPPFSIIEAWTRSPRTLHSLPAEWQDLQTGVHDIENTAADGSRRYYKLAVRRDDDIISFIRYDVSRGAVGLKRLIAVLAGATVLFSGLALLLGLWSSRRVMQPVADLASRLESYDASGPREPLAPHFADDEVGQLAQAFDDYAEHLTMRVRRDREFNADVSHELRTPMAVIQGATEILRDQPDLTPRTKSRIARIDRAAKQCSDLITALLELSREERGQGIADVRRIAEQVVQQQRVLIQNKPVDVLVSGADRLLVDASEAVVAVALGNLVGNACRYTTEGNVEVRLCEDSVEIIDSGPGIAADEAEALFQRGIRGAASGASKGAGIGLAIVRRLCELYGWRVELAPRPDQPGAIATLRFNTPKRR